MKTFFEKWQNGEQGYTMLSTFQTSLMRVYQQADRSNRDILEKAYPEFFTATRIAPEQIDADRNLLNNLNAKLNDWKTELAWTEKELIEQALIDSKAGSGKSTRYLALEKSEQQLKANVREAEQKLGKVEGRVSNPTFQGLVNSVVTRISKTEN
jgi:hypothetical protein